MKKLTFATLLLAVMVFSLYAQRAPNVERLTLIGGTIDNSKHINGITFHDGSIWCLVLDRGRIGRGQYATYNPKNGEWKYSDDKKAQDAILKVSQPFNSPNGLVFVGKKLWVSGSYGKSFGVIDSESWKVEKVFTKTIRPDLEKTNGQSYSDMTFDGENIWIAWHLYHYRLPRSEVQQLLKINPSNGEVIEIYPLPIGIRNVADHGLTYDGESLWHIKGKILSKIDLKGKVIGQYRLSDINGPTGLAWDGSALWISSAQGKLWKLPFE